LAARAPARIEWKSSELRGNEPFIIICNLNYGGNPFDKTTREYWPEFQAELTYHGKNLPAYVIKEFDEYLRCGRLEYG
jgi:hypothetical protein